MFFCPARYRYPKGTGLAGGVRVVPTPLRLVKPELGGFCPGSFTYKHGTARPRECRDNIVTGPGRATPLLLFSCKSRYCPGTFPNTRGVDGIELTASPSRMKYNHAHIAGGMEYVGPPRGSATVRSPAPDGHRTLPAPHGRDFTRDEFHQG